VEVATQARLYGVAMRCHGENDESLSRGLDKSRAHRGETNGRERVWLLGMKADIVACIAASNEGEEGYEKHGRTPEEYLEERRRVSTHESLDRDGIATSRPVTENDVASFDCNAFRLKNKDCRNM